MPFKSKAQERYFHELASQGKLPKSINLNEWDKASKGAKIPERVVPKPAPIRKKATK